MKKDNTIYIGFDTHKKFYHVAYIEEGRGKTAVDYGKIPGSKIALSKLVRKLQSKFPNATLLSSTRRGVWFLDLPKLARLLKTEELTHIYVPEEEDEVIRDLYRLREVAMLDLNDARKRLKAFSFYSACPY